MNRYKIKFVNQDTITITAEKLVKDSRNYAFYENKDDLEARYSIPFYHVMYVKRLKVGEE